MILIRGEEKRWEQMRGEDHMWCEARGCLVFRALYMLRQVNDHTLGNREYIVWLLVKVNQASESALRYVRNKHDWAEMTSVEDWRWGERRLGFITQFNLVNIVPWPYNPSLFTQCYNSYLSQSHHSYVHPYFAFYMNLLFFIVSFLQPVNKRGSNNPCIYHLLQTPKSFWHNVCHSDD